MQVKIHMYIFNLQPRDAICLYVDYCQVELQLGGVQLDPIDFARVLPRQHEQVVRESPMVPGWDSLRGFPAFCASLVLE